MLRRLLGCAAMFALLALVIVVLAVWLLRVPAVPVPRLEGELRNGSLTVDGRTRTFAFYVPRRVRANPPLLVVLHGAMANAQRMRAMTGYSFDELADREGFLVAYPNGVGGNWNDCRAVGDTEAKRLAVNDVAFLRAMVAWFQREHRIATNEVFAAGVSNGAQMAYRLGLEAPDLVRGLAAVAANLPAADNQSCVASGRPVAVMIINGTDDPLNPHQGGPVALFGLFMKRGNVQSTMDTANYWAKLAGHRGAPTVRPMPAATRYFWPSVTLIVVHGGGHSLPHPTVRAPRLIGRTSHDFSGPEEIWKFVAAESAR